MRWVYGSMDLWVYGSMDLWIYGSMDLWIYGSMVSSENDCLCLSCREDDQPQPHPDDLPKGSFGTATCNINANFVGFH